MLFANITLKNNLIILYYYLENKRNKKEKFKFAIHTNDKDNDNQGFAARNSIHSLRMFFLYFFYDEAQIKKKKLHS